jgi:SAM-dependent methyltransferase
MKSRGKKLERQYDQIFDYWTHIVPHRPPFVILCNFDEFWIYDFNLQLFDPVEKFTLAELPSRAEALAFLLPAELDLLATAADRKWDMVKPEIFGTLFQSSMDSDERHAFGAHFTSEFDIRKVVGPTIVRPWREKMAAAWDKVGKLKEVLRDLRLFRVLDPACGSGNFLYVAYRELKRLEREILLRLSEISKGEPLETAVSIHQFHGIDIQPFAVELAKVTLMLAKEQEVRETAKLEEIEEGFLVLENPLPLDNLDKNILCADAVSTQVWSGDAAVHVSIVNWIKGDESGKRKLTTQQGDRVNDPWKIEAVEEIRPSLSSSLDLSSAMTLQANQKPKRCFQGQNPVNEGFFLTLDDAEKWLVVDSKLKDVLFPYMIGRDLVENYGPTRWIIDFAQRDQFEARSYPIAFERVKEKVMPRVLEKAEDEKIGSSAESVGELRLG